MAVHQSKSVSMHTPILNNRFLFKFFFLTIVQISGFVVSAQPGKNSDVIPELIFANPVLVSGVAGKDDAEYRFKNVATDLDAVLKIKKRSASNVIVRNIDVTSFGWDKALQPELGIAGNVPANHSWWVEFELTFFEAGKNKKKKIKEFNATSLDVDGDGVSIKEYVEFYKVKSVKYSNLTNLLETAFENTQCGECGTDSPLEVCSNCGGTGKNGSSDCGNCSGTGKLHSQCDHAWDGETDKIITGPTGNFLNIDTAATAAMATYTYTNKEAITFRMGGISGATVSNAGVRLNSIWFRSFSLDMPLILLPVVLNNFTAKLNNKKINLDWITTDQQNFSHFIVERSFDSKNFKKCTVVLPNEDNKSSQQAYSYLDEVGSANREMIFYRLKMVDANGKAQYSSVVMIRLNESSGQVKLQTYPNPVVSELNVSIPANWQNKVIVYELYKVNGMLAKRIIKSDASATVSINMNDVQSGVYIVKVSSGSEKAVQQIVKN